MPLRMSSIWPLSAACAAAVLLAASAPGAHATLRMSDEPHQAPSVRFEPEADRTHISSRVDGNLCLMLTLPQKWRLASGSDAGIILAAADGAELEAILRPARDVREMPQPDLASRDAALLQRDNEDMFGRPAQAATLSALSSGAKRWTATWIDASFPAASREVTLDTVIIPLSEDWLLELSLSQVDTPAAYEALVGKILAGLKLGAARTCDSDIR